MKKKNILDVLMVSQFCQILFLGEKFTVQLILYNKNKYIYI